MAFLKYSIIVCTVVLVELYILYLLGALKVELGSETVPVLYKRMYSRTQQYKTGLDKFLFGVIHI